MFFLLQPALMPSLLFPAQPAASPVPARAAAASQPKQPLPPPQTSSAGAPNSAGVAKPAPKTTAKGAGLNQRSVLTESDRAGGMTGPG